MFLHVTCQRHGPLPQRAETATRAWAPGRGGAGTWAAPVEVPTCSRKAPLLVRVRAHGAAFRLLVGLILAVPAACAFDRHEPRSVPRAQAASVPGSRPASVLRGPWVAAAGASAPGGRVVAEKSVPGRAGPAAQIRAGARARRRDGWVPRVRSPAQAVARPVCASLRAAEPCVRRGEHTRGGHRAHSNSRAGIANARR